MKSLNNVSVDELLGADNTSKDIHGTKSWVLTLLRQNPDGITAKIISEITEISEQRAREILDELVWKREAYSRKLSKRSKIYYPNGKLIHKYLQESEEIGDKIYRISFHEGKQKPQIQIQERTFSLLEGEKVEGSVFIDVDNIESFMDFIKNMLDKYNNFREESD